jgi:hypothetical protein
MIVWRQAAAHVIEVKWDRIHLMRRPSRLFYRPKLQMGAEGLVEWHLVGETEVIWRNLYMYHFCITNRNDATWDRKWTPR